MSPEDQRSLIVIEAIDAAGRKPPPPLVIIEGKYIMSDWFSPEMDLEATIIILRKGYINNAIGMEFLKHFIKHINAGSQSK